MHQFASQYRIGKEILKNFYLTQWTNHRNISIQRLVYIDIEVKADDCLNIVMDNNSNTGIDMVKPFTDSNYGSKYRRTKTEQTEDDRINKPAIVDSRAQLKRILVVDDNSDIAFTLRLGLENADSTMQVYSYDNPVKALADFEPNFYDLLLLDVNMPMMNGFELCQKLLQKDLNVKVCFMTSGEINIEAVREVHPLKSIGCFIKKPINADALLKRIRAELE